MKNKDKNLESKKTLCRIPLPLQAEKSFKDKKKYDRKDTKKLAFEDFYYVEDEYTQSCLISEEMKFVGTMTNGGEKVAIYDTTHARKRKDEREVPMEDAVKVIEQIIPTRWNDINNDKTLNNKEFFTVESETGMTIYGRLNIKKIYNSSPRDVQISTLPPYDKEYYTRNPNAKLDIKENEFIIITLIYKTDVGIDHNTALNYILTNGKPKRQDNRIGSAASMKKVNAFAKQNKFRR
jgi:hypothetical protein